MLHKFAAVFFVDETGLIKPSCVFPESFLVRPKFFNYILEGYRLARCNQKQYLNPVMIRHPLKMPFHLFGCLNLSHALIIQYSLHTTSLQTPVCKDVVEGKGAGNFGENLLLVYICNCKLKNCGEGGPKQIWDIDIGYPAGVRPDGNHRPDERAEDKQDIDSREEIILEPELDRRKSEIENEIKNERQCNYKRNLPLPGHQKYFAKRNGN